MRHSAFVSRIEKTAPGKIKKRRRPGKKLVAGLESLLDTLPDVEASGASRKAGSEDDDEWEGLSEDEDVVDTSSLGELGKIARVRRKRKPEVPGKMQLKTLKSRPGATKRKAKLESAEMDRFRKNMAQMAQGQSVPSKEGSSTADRWAALRGFIGQTMEQSAHFRA